jgi:hypothetical protein
MGRYLASGYALLRQDDHRQRRGRHEGLPEVAEAPKKAGEISSDRLGRWLKKISGRPVAGLKLVAGMDRYTRTSTYCLTETK